MPERRPLPEIERALRGMERCGYRFIAVQKNGQIQGYAMILPDTPMPVSLRTEKKWRQRWYEIENKEPRRAIASYLAGTGRAQPQMPASPTTA